MPVDAVNDLEVMWPSAPVHVRMSRNLEITLDLPEPGSRGLLRALHVQLRQAIVGGRLAAGVRLPASRHLAETYRISRNTVVAAYDLLLSEGYVSTNKGGGTVVANVTGRRANSVGRAPADRLSSSINPVWLAAGNPNLALVRAGATYDFSLGVPDARIFPFEVWRRLSGRALRRISKQPCAYGEVAGSPALRRAIASHVAFARAVSCSADDIIVTSGAQQAFDLLARVLITPTRTVAAIEDPGYPPMRRALEAAGAKVVGIPVDEQGIEVGRIPSQAKVVCVTPSHQFPMGVAMSMARRKGLLEHAKRHATVIIEDDYDGEFRHDDRPLDALQTLDLDQQVCYVGTFSKSIFPGLRLGYVIAPAWLRESLLGAKLGADLHVCSLSDEVLAEFMLEGHLVRHVRRMRSIYSERRAGLLRALREESKGLLEPLPSMAGLHLAAKLKARQSAAALAEAAEAIGIRVEALNRYSMSRRLSANAIGFGFGAIDAGQVGIAVRRLVSLVR